MRTEHSKGDETITALEEVFDASFQVWVREGCATWEPDEVGTDLPSTVESRFAELPALLDAAIQSSRPQVTESSPGQQLLAVPLANKARKISRCAVVELASNSPELVLQLAETRLRELRQESELVGLREENEYFLKQVSEDFEELTFLRSMAERLAVGNCSNDIDELIFSMVPLLGAAANAEELYYFRGKAGVSPRVSKHWLYDEALASRFETSQLEALVETYADDALERPVVKNGLYESGLCPELPGLGEFILVTVSTGIGPIGWLLALNRRQPVEVEQHQPLWALSHHEFGTSEASLIGTAAAMLASHAHNVSFFKERESLLVSVVRTLVTAIESKDDYTCGHSERVARYGKRLAAEVGYDQEACERLYLTGLLHDVGKIGVSDAVLKKEGALTAEEFAEIQKHPDLGWAILRGLEQLDYVLPGVLHHHERVDGKGYPDQLCGDEIPRDGQVLAVVDAFDAMTSDRPYRTGMAVEKAVKIFQEGAGTQWDAELVKTFLSILPDILEIKASYKRQPLPTREKQAHRTGEVVVDSRTTNCPPVCHTNS